MTDQQTIDAAITKCHQAWTRQIEAHNKKENQHDTDIHQGPYCKQFAGQAYRNALPYLSSPQNIDAFIACVTHGMAIGAIADKLGTKLLYAAQVATTSRKAQHQINRDANRVPRSSSAWAGTNSTNSANSAETGVPPSPSQPANINVVNKATPGVTTNPQCDNLTSSASSADSAPPADSLTRCREAADSLIDTDHPDHPATTPTPLPSDPAKSNPLNSAQSAKPVYPPSRPGRKQKAWKRSHWRPVPKRAA